MGQSWQDWHQHGDNQAPGYSGNEPSGGGGGGGTPTPTTPTGGGLNIVGTYNPITGVYTAPNGTQQSMAHAPPGAIIIGTTNPLQNTYIGGGGGGSGSNLNVSTVASQQQAIKSGQNQGPSANSSDYRNYLIQQQQARQQQNAFNFMLRSYQSDPRNTNITYGDYNLKITQQGYDFSKKGEPVTSIREVKQGQEVIKIGDTYKVRELATGKTEDVKEELIYPQYGKGTMQTQASEVEKISIKSRTKIENIGGVKVPFVSYYYTDKSGKEVSYYPTENEMRNIGEVQAKSYSKETYDKYKFFITGVEAGTIGTMKTKEAFGKVYKGSIAEKGVAVISSGIEQTNKDIQNIIKTSPGIESVDWNKVGANIEKKYRAEIESYKSMGTQGKVYSVIAQTGYGVTKYLAKDLYEHPTETLLLYGGAKAVGAGWGMSKELVKQDLSLQYGALKEAGVLGTGKASRAIFKYGPIVVKDATIKEMAIGGFKAGMVGTVGAGLTIQVLTSPDWETAAGKTAVSLKNLYLIGKGFSKGETWISEPKVKTLVKPRVEDVYFPESQMLVRDLKGDISTYSVFKKYTTVYPAEIQITTRAQRILDKIASGIEPLYQGPAGKTKFYITKTLFPEKVETPFYVAEMGPRTKSILKVSGVTYKDVNLLTGYEKFSAIDKRLVRELVSKGRGLSENQIKTAALVEPSKSYRFADIQATKVYTGARKSMFDIDELAKGMTRIPKGKTTRLYRQLIESKEVSLPEISKVEIFKGGAVTKDVTKPFARASGEIGRMTGVTIRGKEIIKQKPYKMDIESYKPLELKANLPKEARIKPIEYAKQLEKKGIIKYEEIGKGRLQELKRLGLAQDIEAGFQKADFSNAPEMKGVIFVKKELPGFMKQKKVAHEIKHLLDEGKFGKETGIKYVNKPSEQSAMAIEGQWAREGIPKLNLETKQIAKRDFSFMVPTSKKVPSKSVQTKYVSQVPSFKSFNIPVKETELYTKGITREKELERFGEIGLGREKLLPAYKEISKFDERLIEKERLTQKPMERLMERERLMTKPMEKLMEKQRLQERLQERLKEKLMEKQKTTYKLPNMLKEKIITKTPTIMLPSFDINKRRRKKGFGYDLFVTKKGKPEVIAKGLSKEAALDIGTREIFSSLKASFGIRKSDLGIRDVATGGEFERFFGALRRPTAKSRLNKFGDLVYVQKQGISMGGAGRGRLTTMAERKSINEARMNKIMRSIA